MKATMTISPASQSRKVRFKVSARVINRLAAFTAAACVAGTWLCAMLDKDTACAVIAAIGVVAVLTADSTSRKGGEL